MTLDMIILADYQNSLARVYRFDPITELWVPLQILTGGSAESGYGYTLAASDDQLLVGAPGNDFLCDEYYDNPESCDGREVYVYKFRNGAWQAAGRFRASGEPNGNYFGAAIDIDGTTAVVGAPLEFVNDAFTGAV